MRVAFVLTCDCGGLGHLARAAAIERALGRRGWAGEYRMFPRADVAGLATWAPDLALVDLRWRDVPSLPCPAWLLVRATTSPWDGFDAGRWERVIGIEPGATGPLTDEVPPVVMVNPDEVAHGFDGMTVVMHAGSAAEVARLSDMSGPGAVVIAGEPWPAARFLPFAARVYTGGGYNSVWEARWLGYAERTTFVPFPRGNDDQAARIAGRVPMTENGADVLARWML